MIYIQRKESKPTCLDKKIDYKCGDVLQKLQNDFYGKCYICETAPSSTNVEHFIPHNNNITLKFDWNNLFLACSHCNNIKLQTHILNCTVLTDIENRIEFGEITDVRTSVTIKCKENYQNDKLTKDTVDLLIKVYNGHTEIKMIDANKLKEKLVEDIIYFKKLLLDYSKERYNELKVKSIEEKIKEELHKGSKLTAFKRQIVREKYKEFEKYFD